MNFNVKQNNRIFFVMRLKIIRHYYRDLAI